VPGHLPALVVSHALAHRQRHAVERRTEALHRRGCGFHAIWPPSPRLSGQAFHAHPAICSTTIRPGSRSAATQGWHC
jgi:hypothetical protein